MLPCPLSPPASVLGCLVSKDIKVTLSQCLISSEAQLAVGSLGSRGLCARSQGWAGGVLSEPAAPAQTQSQEPPCCSPRCGSQPRMPPTVPDSHKWVELVLQWEETLAVLGPGSAVNGAGGPSELAPERPQGSPASSSVWREDPGLLSRPCTRLPRGVRPRT